MPEDRSPRRRPQRRTKQKPQTLAVRGRWRFVLLLLPLALAGLGTYSLLHSPYLEVHAVRVAGTDSLDRAAVADLTGLKHKSMLDLPLDEARGRLLAVPQVRSVKFSRHWPNTVIVRIEERQPAAFWSVGGIDYPVDQDGIVLEAGAPSGPAPRIVENANRTMVALSRILIPLFYTTGDRFHHDLAIPVPPLAGLQRARELSGLDPSSDEFRFAVAALVRERNRVVHALEEAAGVIDAFGP